MAPDSYLRRHWGWIITVSLYLVVVTIAVSSVDFGFHWDEPLQWLLVTNSVSSGTFLPNGFYNYPSMTYALSLVGYGTARIGAALQSAEMTEQQFYLVTRSIFIALSLAGGLALYEAVTRLNRSLSRAAQQLAGVVASATYLLSFQAIYHSRWIAPDMVLAAATCVFILTLALRWRTHAPVWLAMLPAASAGVATSTKYQGGVLILAALGSTVVWSRRDRCRLGVTVGRLARDLGVALAAFLVITPGAALQPMALWADLRFEREHYATGHGNFLGAQTYVFPDSADYLSAEIKYVLAVLPQPHLATSLLVCVMAGLGFVALFRRDKWLAVLLAAIPAVLLVYFASLVVYQARNLLMVLPFLATLAGSGIGVLQQRLHGRYARVGAGLILSAVALSGLVDAISSAETIRDGPDSVISRGLHAFRSNHPDTCVRVSPVTADQVGRAQLSLEPRDSRDCDGELVLITYSELQQLREGHTSQHPVQLDEWPTGDPGFYVTLGTREVDLDYYPTWAGNDRVYVLGPTHLARIGLSEEELAFLEVGETSALVED